MAAQSTAINVTATGVVSATPATLRGFWIFSTAGATVTLYDNASAASGTILATFILAANGWEKWDFADGVRCANGIFLNASAAITGNVRIG